ncbi:MAG: enoyl-CoA hydratase/isomerase family protein [Alphaproteobacteria bacterium]
MSELVLTRREGPVTRITLNRADKANALNPELAEALLAAVEAAGTDDGRVILFDGVGKHFCGGFDLADTDILDGPGAVSDGDMLWRLIRIEMLLQAVWHAPKPTIALGKGRVMGAGTDLFAACSQRVVTPGTTFRMPGLGFGILLGTRRLVARIGADAARRIQNEIATFGAEEAHSLGFATHILGEEDWPQFVEGAAKAAQTLAPDASAMLFATTAADTRDLDMATLVRSAGRPGLVDRIRAFRAATLKAAGRS